MNPLHVLARPEFTALAAALLHFLWQGTLIALLLAAARRSFRIERAQQRYAVSLSALAAMALCPVITYFAALPAWQPPQELAVTGEAGAAFADGPVVAAGMSLESVAEAAQPYLLAGWLIGVCTFGFRLAVGFVGVWRCQRQRLPLPLELASRVERLGRRLGIDAVPRVFLSRHVGEALAVGFWRPIVLVPAAWVTEMPLGALEAVIAHELAHLRRFDLWVNLVQRVVETLLFYHPAVWWVSRQLRQEREMCCDELAVGATGERLAYVEALELVARERLAGVRPALAAGIRGETNMKLLARVQNLLGGRAGESGSLWPAGLLALLLPLAMWGMTWGILSPAPAAAVANDDRDDDDDDDEDDDDDRKEVRDDDEGEKKERKDGEEKEGAAKIRKDGDRPRKEGERRDGDQPKKGPRDGEDRKEGVKKEIRRDGDAPKKGQEGEFRKDPVKKEAFRKEHPEGDAPGKKKIVKEGDAPRKESPEGRRKEVGEGGGKLEAMIRELRAENEKLRGELRELRGDKVAKPAAEKEVRRDKKEAAAREELIKKFGGDGERKLLAEKKERAGDDERAAIEKKLRGAREDKERAAVEEKYRLAAEQKLRAAAEDKFRAAVEEKERAAANEKKERAAVEAKLRAAAEEKERAAVNEKKERAAAERKQREASKDPEKK